ncbi:uncharacterized protein LOC103105208 isoform X1 [Monodelphis domestica]|uniref:uncharacterized protein LOC103105208 isoform X1 n=1 Tax=Monodelphis domestica TaxID=13616 RepID=UPI0004430F30|nr:uncharacterized protein LOC103105208 isoform X1 [Monodelphis domestica]
MAGSQSLPFWGGICFIFFLKIQISSSTGPRLYPLGKLAAFRREVGRHDKFLVTTGASPAEAQTPSPTLRSSALSILSGSHYRLRKGWTRNRNLVPPMPKQQPWVPEWLHRKAVALKHAQWVPFNSTSHNPKITLHLRDIQPPLEQQVDTMGSKSTPQEQQAPKVIWTAPGVIHKPQYCNITSSQPQQGQFDIDKFCLLWRTLHRQSKKVIPPPSRPRKPRHHHGLPLWVGIYHMTTMAPQHHLIEKDTMTAFLTPLASSRVN